MTRRSCTLPCTALLVAMSAAAHTALDSSSPASGSILAESPDTITLNFSEPTRLVSVLRAAPTESVRLSFVPAASATTFTIVSPALAPGRNEVQWHALSLDGHVVDGSIILVVRPSR